MSAPGRWNAWRGLWFGKKGVQSKNHMPQKEKPPDRNRSGSWNPGNELFAEVKLLNENLITLARRALEVIQQAAALGHHHQETAA